MKTLTRRIGFAGGLGVVVGALSLAPLTAQVPSQVKELIAQFDADGDGYCDQIEDALGSAKNDKERTPESDALADEDQDGVADACQDDKDNDQDGLKDGDDPGCAPIDIFTMSFPAAAGLDIFTSTLRIDLDALSGTAGGNLGKVELNGPTVIRRSAPRIRNGRREFDTEVVAMQVHGLTQSGALIVVIEDPARSSKGSVKAQRTQGECGPEEDCDYPATGEFSVSALLLRPGQAPLTLEPIEIHNPGINFIPPIARGNPCYGAGPYQHCPGGNMVALTVDKVYAAKFVCVEEVGPAGDALKPGNYRTVVNIHNPTNAQAEFTKKALVDLPEDVPPIPPSRRRLIELPPDFGIGIDCDDIAQLLGGPGPLGNGFLIIESPWRLELDVVAVYTQKVTKNKIVFQLEMPEEIVPDLPFPLAKKLETVVEVRQHKILDPEALVRQVLRKELAAAGFKPGVESSIQIEILDIELGVGSSIDVERIEPVKVAPRKVKAALPPHPPPHN